MDTIFANVVAIYRRELQAYFASPFSYIIAGVFWLLSGVFFYATLTGVQAFTTNLDRSNMATVFPVDAAYALLAGIREGGVELPGFLQTLGNLSLFILPMLSMGLYAEERKRGTLELLATSPVTNWVVALGKLLGVVTFVITLILPLMVYEAIALGASNPPVQLNFMLLGHLGLILLAASILSLGMFVSSLTDSTILAAILTFALILLLWIVNFIATSVGGPLGEALGHLSLVQNYSGWTQGIFDTSSLIVFICYIILGLFLTAQSIEAFRFHRS